MCVVEQVAVYSLFSGHFTDFADELDNMSSTERISFLQEKLQEIRKCYMSLKSEVASIDRRRKRLKKKEREGMCFFFCFFLIDFFYMRLQ